MEQYPEQHDTLLHLEHNRIARLIIGSVFYPKDLIAYTIGAISVYIIDKKFISQINYKTLDK